MTPYATSDDSDKGSVGSSDVVMPAAAGGRRRGRPQDDWRARQSIPLPPKPDEPGRAGGLRTSPPPPYYPVRLPPPPPVPVPHPHGYVNDDVDAAACYFQPLSDDEARLVRSAQAAPDTADNPAFETENVYLEGRRDVDEDADAEAIELRDLTDGRASAAVRPQTSAATAQNSCSQNADEVTTEDHRRPGVIYAIRRQSPSDITT